MSQQPPYGSDQPYQQPYQQPYTPYSQGGYPNPYAPYQSQPPRRDHTVRNVLLVLGVVLLLFCGGAITIVVLAINSVEDTFDPDFAGSSDQPLTVEEGEAFSIRGFDYEAGWTVTSTGPAASGGGEVVVGPVRATNNRSDDDAESVYLNFRFFRDNEQLGTVDCFGGSSVAAGRSVTLDCTGFGEDIRGFDEIEVYDDSIFE